MLLEWKISSRNRADNLCTMGSWGDQHGICRFPTTPAPPARCTWLTMLAMSASSVSNPAGCHDSCLQQRKYPVRVGEAFMTGLGRQVQDGTADLGSRYHCWPNRGQSPVTSSQRTTPKLYKSAFIDTAPACPLSHQSFCQQSYQFVGTVIQQITLHFSRGHFWYQIQRWVRPSEGDEVEGMILEHPALTPGSL